MKRKAELLRDLSAMLFAEIPVLHEFEQPLTPKLFMQKLRLRNRDLEFRMLKQITETDNHSALLMDFRAHETENRYCDVLPYVDTKVDLSDHGYINASIVNGSMYDAQGMFVCTQGPLKETAGRFWQMVWEYSVPLIVMVTDFEEGGRVKCDRYIPERGSKQFGAFKVSVTAQEHLYERLVSRDIVLEKDGERRSVKHLQSTAWPDHGVPDLDQEFDSLMYLVTAMLQTRQLPSLPKVVVHCSAGIGRTGTIIGIYSIVSAVRQAEVHEEPTFSVFGAVRKMREQRFGMVQTREQYDFIYRFIEYWLSRLES
jgi:receptor-type tyrosine-protein phosphatase gamma